METGAETGEYFPKGQKNTDQKESGGRDEYLIQINHGSHNK